MSFVDKAKDAAGDAIDKAKNAAEDAVGKAKEVAGDVTDNKDLKAEGKKDQGEAGVKKAGQNIKDALS
ncbi:CsbD family protein [Williamsia deligens]|uniref:CsbD family protein n=1 Tax=Williamsia deligens TaxID=321325 RepID=A0ABW3G6Q1_9NOCA|nr:CsbD family protein [Williamsia deligens]MCP2193929.1 CsbD-like [Williamsia deligens]